jgi:hypothetical protein
MVVALLAFALASTLVPRPAAAADGRVEINQARAQAGGITPGDTPGFPITLSLSGSYVLTGNLTVADAALDAIEVGANGVAIDLNGFELVGPSTCTGFGSGLTCSGGTGRGVDGQYVDRLSVWGGRVRNFGSVGVWTLDRAVLRELTVELNGGTGIATGAHARIHSVTAARNRGFGIGVGSASVIEASIAVSNFSTGIRGDTAAAIIGCTSSGNGGDGIYGSSAAVVRNSAGYGNQGSGVVVGGGGLVSDTTSMQNTLDGIVAFTGATVQRCSVYFNRQLGLDLSSSATYRENTLNQNDLGEVNGGVNMGSNSCNGATTCP